jgi:phage N-6-adenine-methyltransferase
MTTDTPKKTGPSMARGSSRQDYSTPPEFMAAVRSKFGPIIFDLAASVENKQHPDYYSEEGNALVQDWHQIHLNRSDPHSGFLWLNPPFGDIEPWAKKCAEEMKLGARILFLVPASVGSKWYWKYVAPYASVLALKQRICFDGKNGFPKDLILACYCYGLKGFQPWDWKKEAAA